MPTAMTSRGRCGGPLTRGAGNTEDAEGWYSLSPTCLNAAVSGPLGKHRWRVCPVAVASTAAAPWTSDIMDAYRLQRRLGLAPETRTRALDQALMVVDDEVARLEAVERKRAEDDA
jgi:hypothetical protein